MRRMLCAVLLSAFAIVGNANTASAGVILTMPGPLNSSNIVVTISNTGPTDITSVAFNLTTAATPSLVIDTAPPQIFNTTAPAGGTITYGGNNGPPATMFSVNFTNFNTGESSQFNWDPDTISNAGFNAVVGDLIGTSVTVSFSDGSQAVGTLVALPNGDLSFSANAVGDTVPEPVTLAVFGLMAAGGGLYSRRRKA